MAGRAGGMAAEPTVVFLDLDGTIVGRVDCAVCEYELLTSTAGARGQAFKAFRAALVRRLRYGIIRPHFEAFCRAAGLGGPSPRLRAFVYTASEARWAAFLVPCLEAALGVRFGRPIFTRDHCVAGPGGSVRKSLARVLPAAARVLRRQLGLPPAWSPARVLMVDNTPGILVDGHQSLLLCPTYDYCYVYDVLGNLEVDALHGRAGRLAAALARFGLFPGEPEEEYQRVAARYYAHLGRLAGEALEGNARALAEDRFWLRLARQVDRLAPPPGGGGLDVAALAAAVRAGAGPRERGRTYGAAHT